MDRVVARRGIDRRLLVAGAALVALLLLALGWRFVPAASGQTVAAERLTIAPVRQGVFDDFLPTRARVEPLVTVFLDAVEGGRVEELLVEDGAMVAKGQPLAILSNSDLQLNLLARQTEVLQQVNSMRSQELALAQTRLANERARIEADLATDKARRQYEMQRPLAARGFVAGRVFQDSEQDYRANARRSAVLARAQATDERLQSSQLAQLRSSAASLNASLGIARETLDALNLRAPVAGQLTAFSIQVGQSMKRGERLGQIDSPGRSKLVAGIDEFYLGRVRVGQRATIEQGGRTWRLKVAKIYPQVRQGQFEVDLFFAGLEPAGLQRGQSLQARLTLGDPTPARLIPNGSFVEQTGGAWAFVVAPDGRSAVRRPVRLGRRNAEAVEVLGGLDPGERVIVSPYSGFAGEDRLAISAAGD